MARYGLITLVLTGASTYTETTTVSAGILSLTTGSINSSALVTVLAGALTLGNASALSDTGTLNLASGMTLNLNAGMGTTETIGALMLTNGTYAASGTYSTTVLGGMDPGVTFAGSGENLTIGAVPESSTMVSGVLLRGVLIRCCGVARERWKAFAESRRVPELDRRATCLTLQGGRARPGSRARL